MARAPKPPRESVVAAGGEKAAGMTLARVPFEVTL
jgi:hypothetical protein